jgi:amidase
MATADDEGLVFTGVARQAQLVHDRQVSPHELVALYLERIAQLDPVLNAFRVVPAEQAMTEAAQVERRLAAGEVLPLAGVPIAIKDDTDVAGVSSMCGTAIGSTAGCGSRHPLLQCSFERKTRWHTPW